MIPRLWVLPGIGATIDLNRVASITPVESVADGAIFKIHIAGVEPLEIKCSYHHTNKEQMLAAFKAARQATIDAWAGNDYSELRLSFAALEHIEEPEPGVFVLRAAVTDPLQVDLLRRHISVGNAHKAIDTMQELDGNASV